MSSSDRVLVVRQEGDACCLSSPPGYEIVYRFVDAHPDDGFAAWPSGEKPGCQQVDVAARCRGFDGGFDLQALNRIVAQAIIRERPRALVVQGFHGCTADLSRVARMLGTPSLLYIPGGSAFQPDATNTWQQACLAQFSHVLSTDGGSAAMGIDLLPVEALDTALAGLRTGDGGSVRFTYGTYEFALRDHPLLSAMQASEVRHFAGLDTVLDVACGAGIFMEALCAAGHRATGVERDPQVAAYARGMGLDVIEADALAYLESATAVYDGIYCSHFIEHVPVDVLRRLLELLYRRASPGGVVVLVFPDPESIRSQLLGFWRDPEHVRFYHPELVAAMATVAGFTVEWTSYDEQPHEVVPFPPIPPALPAIAVPEAPARVDTRQGMGERLLSVLGLQSRRRAAAEAERLQTWSQALAAGLASQRAALEALDNRTRTLWSVSQTWAWNDNATIRLRRREH